MILNLNGFYRIFPKKRNSHDHLNPKNWFNPFVKRTPAISHRTILWSQNFLNLSINIPSTRQYLSWQVFQKFSRDRQDILIFWDRKSRNWLFFNFFRTKVSNFVSNLNDDCSQLSFEVIMFLYLKNCRFQDFWSIFFRLNLGHFGDLPRLQFQPQQPQ